MTGPEAHHHQGVEPAFSGRNVADQLAAMPPQPEAVAQEPAPAHLPNAPTHAPETTEHAPNVPTRTPEATATPEAHTEHNAIVVERRRLGNTEVTGVMCAHTAENGKQVLDAMRGSRVLALEMLGNLDEPGRRKAEAALTAALAKMPDQERIAAMGQEVRALQVESVDPASENDNPNIIETMLKDIKGTDKQIRILDIGPDHPDFPLVETARQTEVQLATTAAELQPPQAVRAALEQHAIAQGNAYAARETAMKKQLQSVANESNEPDSTAAMVGAMHYRVFQELGEPLDPTVSQQTAEIIRQTIMTPVDRVVDAVRETGEAPEELINRAMVDLYFRVVKHETTSEAETHEVVNRMDDGQIARLIIGLSNRDAHKDDQQRRDSLQRYLQSAYDIIDHAIKQDHAAAEARRAA